MTNAHAEQDDPSKRNARVPRQAKKLPLSELDFSARIEKAIEAIGMSRRNLAKAMGVSVTTVYGWSKRKTINRANLSALAKMSGFELEWLLEGGETARREDRPPSYVPLLEWGDLGTKFNPSTKPMIRTIREMGPRSFALPVESDAMNSDLLVGGAAVVDPDLVPQAGDVVAVRTNEHGYIFRRYRRDGNTLVLTASHPDYSPIRANKDDCTVLGVVREFHRFFR